MLPQKATTKKRHTQINQTRTTAVAQRSSQQVHAFDRVLFRRHSVMFGGDFGVRRNPFPVHIHVAQLNARLAVALASRRSVPGRALMQWCNDVMVQHNGIMEQWNNGTMEQ